MSYLNNATGFRFTVYCGGRDEEGRVTTFTYATLCLMFCPADVSWSSVHGGKSDGPHPTTFGGFMGREMNDQIKDKFREFILYPDCMLSLVTASTLSLMRNTQAQAQVRAHVIQSNASPQPLAAITPPQKNRRKNRAKHLTHQRPQCLIESERQMICRCSSLLVSHLALCKALTNPHRLRPGLNNKLLCTLALLHRRHHLSNCRYCRKPNRCHLPLPLLVFQRQH